MPRPALSRHGELIRASKQRQLDEAFKGKVFDIVREVHLPKGQVFVTQFGQKGQHGYIIQDRATGERHVVGWTVLKHIHDRYLGVTLPSVKTRYGPR